MIRTLLFLLLIMIGLALLRWLVKDVSKAVFRALGLSKDGEESGASRGDPKTSAGSAGGQTTNRLVRDPVSGTYIDERVAFKDTIDGKPFFFESKENRDTYLKNRRTG
jgi:YHS domain-containing protein